MRIVFAALMLVFLATSVHAQQVDKDHLESLEIACGFGLDEACDELVELKQAGKSVALTICNRTTEEISIAIADEVGRVKDRQYRARGWWSLQPAVCRDFWEWPLKDAALHIPILHLVHAVSKNGKVWGGAAVALCTLEGSFDITGDHLNDCRKRGFFNIDLFAGGWHTKGYTFDLTF
ncbi:MAG: DUF1036 domain-containing protein [Alphaproteobacteria bacterium]|jgi:uncharacterized membrane protein|nr:DUF1036 domain-containing protein [Alphaproteobacteria bacterium]